MISSSIEEYLEELTKYSFDIHLIRPASEIKDYSLFIKVTHGCPWNKCGYCDCHIGEKFIVRSVGEVKRDIDTVKAIYDTIIRMAKELGGLDTVSMLISSSVLYGKSIKELSGSELKNYMSLVTTFNWIRTGCRSVFLQDGDNFTMPTPDLVEILEYTRKTFPTVKRISSYVRFKTLLYKPLDELKEIRLAGLLRLHPGLESGDDEVLRYINKGITSREAIEAGKKAKEAGFELAVYVMPGVGGRALWKQHAMNTARVLNEINPDFIMMRPYVPRKNTPMYEDYIEGKFQLTSPHERLRELKILIESLNITGKVCFDQPTLCAWYRDILHRIPLFNPNKEYKFPEEKEKILKLIDLGLSLDESMHIHPKDIVELDYL